MFPREARLWSFIPVSGRLAILMLVVLVAGCANLPRDYEKEPSTAIRDTGNTQLAQRARPLVAAHAGESGFYLLSDGIEALATSACYSPNKPT